MDTSRLLPIFRLFETALSVTRCCSANLKFHCRVCSAFTLCCASDILRIKKALEEKMERPFLPVKTFDEIFTAARRLVLGWQLFYQKHDPALCSILFGNTADECEKLYSTSVVRHADPVQASLAHRATGDATARMASGSDGLTLEESGGARMAFLAAPLKFNENKEP